MYSEFIVASALVPDFKTQKNPVSNTNHGVYYYFGSEMSGFEIGVLMSEQRAQ